MKVKNLDRLCIGVPKLDEGMALFSKVLGLEFEFSGENVMPNGNTIKLAISNQGIELLEVPDQKIHFRSFHFKVNDIEAAAQDVKAQGIDIVSEFSVGQMDEKVMDLFGLRAILIDYPGDDPGKAAAGKAKY